MTLMTSEAQRRRPLFCEKMTGVRLMTTATTKRDSIIVKKKSWGTTEGDASQDTNYSDSNGHDFSVDLKADDNENGNGDEDS